MPTVLPPARSDISNTPSPSNAVAKVGLGKFWDYVTNLLGTAGTQAGALAALGAAKSGALAGSGITGAAASGANVDITSLGGLTTGLSLSRVKGLIGAPNAATPLTKYDLSADEVVLRNANGGTVTRYLTGTITNDLGLAGSAANGRDQAAAFAINSWIYIYFIWNGTTLATVSSLAVPTTGPTLPATYTHWAFATALRWNGSSNIIPTYARGAWCYYASKQTALSSGAATVETTVSLSSIIPPSAAAIGLQVFVNNTAATNQNATLRLVSGSDFWVATAYPSPANASGDPVMPNIGSSFIYLMASASATLTVSLNRFSVPNGDA